MRMIVFVEKVFSTVSSFSMIADHDRVIIALSGGADSVALLAAMAEIAPRYNLKLSAAHVHHGLRGAEADRDAAFAETDHAARSPGGMVSRFPFTFIGPT